MGWALAVQPIGQIIKVAPLGSSASSRLRAKGRSLSHRPRAQEDARYGKGKRGDELPKELERRQDRLDALRKARAELEAEAAADNARRREPQARAAEEQAAEAAAQAADAEAAAAADNDEADAESESAAQALAKEAQQAERRARAARGRAELARRLAIEKAQAAGLSIPNPLSSVDPLAMPSRNLPTTAAGDPKANAQRNFTDPDSHILKGGDGWIQGYNCQAAVDGDHQIIVAVGVSNQASDQHHFIPMLERIVANTGQLPEKMIADAGYCSTANIEASEQRGLDSYLSTSRQEHGKRPRPSPADRSRQPPVPIDSGKPLLGQPSKTLQAHGFHLQVAIGSSTIRRSAHGRYGSGIPATLATAARVAAASAGRSAAALLGGVVADLAARESPEKP